MEMKIGQYKGPGWFACVMDAGGLVLFLIH